MVTTFELIYYPLFKFNNKLLIVGFNRTLEQVKNKLLKCTLTLMISANIDHKQKELRLACNPYFATFAFAFQISAF